MSRIHLAFRAAILVQLFSLVSTVISLIGVPLYLRAMGLDNYGILLVAITVAGYVTMTDAGLSWACVVLISDANGRDDLAGIASVFHAYTAFIRTVSIIVIIVTAALVGANQIPSVAVRCGTHFTGLAVAVGIQAIGTLVICPPYNLMQGLQNASVVAVITGITRIAGSLLALAAAYWTGNPVYVLGTQAICFLASGAVAWRYVRRTYPWVFESASPGRSYRHLFRYGAANFGVQIGETLASSAPVLAINWYGGSDRVPAFTLTMTLILLPMGFVRTFAATLQAGYGEAAARGEFEWISSTLRRTFSAATAFGGLLGAGYLVSGPDFLSLWTGNRVSAPAANFTCAYLVVLASMYTSIFVFAFAGIGRLKWVSPLQIAYGLLSFLLCPVFAVIWGEEWVGLGVVTSAAITNFYLLPSLMRKTLGSFEFTPHFGMVARAVFLFALSLLAGKLAGSAARDFSGTAKLLAETAAVSIVYAAGSAWLLPEYFGMITAAIRPADRGQRASPEMALPR